MNKQDEIADINERHWEKMVKEGCEFTRPWLDLDRDTILQYASGERVPASDLSVIYPASVLVGAEGNEVLCLGAGGGQQSAVFGVLGARVTVVELADGQLEGDRSAAAHYGYEMTAIHADMRDLSSLDDDSYDLVYQEGTCYVPDLPQVYSGVARVLRGGGLYRVGVTNPAVEFVDPDDWDGEGYRIKVPYSVKTRRRGDDREGAVEFRHFFSDIFNGLIALGLSVQEVQEAPCHLQHDPKARPGSWEHAMAHIPWGLAIVARKESRDL
jgi:SAM-dependent methyltransferase